MANGLERLLDPGAVTIVLCRVRVQNRPEAGHQGGQFVVRDRSAALLVCRCMSRRCHHPPMRQRFAARTGKGSEYRLTPAGEALERVLMELGRWSINWLYEELRPRDIDPVTLLWWMHRRLVFDALPSDHVTVEFDFTAPVPTRIWLVLDRREASVCTKYPGYDIDVIVRCPTPVLSAIFSGVDDWHSCVASGVLDISGPPRLTKALPRWFSWSPFVADVVAAEARLVRA
jgi:hypothetical protein